MESAGSTFQVFYSGLKIMATVKWWCPARMESWPVKPVMFTGHAPCIFEQSAKSLPVNLIFCLLVKIKSHSLTENHMRIRISSLFSNHLTHQKTRYWRSKNFLAQLVIVSGHGLKIILSTPAIGRKSAVKAMILSALKREELWRLKR